MKRTVSVEATVSFEFEVDDEAASEWDQATILKVLEKRGKGNDIYTESATLENLLGHLGIQLCVENRDIDRIDGWADFPREAASGNSYGVDWCIEHVLVDGERVTS